MSQTTEVLNPLNQQQNERAAAVALASSLGAPSTRALLEVADYIVGCQCPTPELTIPPFTDFAPLGFLSEPVEFDFIPEEVNEALIKSLFGCDEACEVCPFAAEGEKQDVPTFKVGDKVRVKDGAFYRTYGEVHSHNGEFDGETGVVTTDPDDDGDYGVQLDGKRYDSYLGDYQPEEAFAPESLELVIEDSTPEPEGAPKPAFAVGDYLRINDLGVSEGISRDHALQGRVTKVVEAEYPMQWGDYYYETEARPTGVWEGFLEYAPEYLIHEDIEGPIFVTDVAGFDALPVGAIIREVRADGDQGAWTAVKRQSGKFQSLYALADLDNESLDGFAYTGVELLNSNGYEVIHLS